MKEWLENVDSSQAILIAVTVVFFCIIVSYIFSLNDKNTITVEGVHEYPIKSCGEVSLQEATATPGGFENDRILQVVDKDFKPISPRDKENAKLFHIMPQIDGRRLVLKVKGSSTESGIEVDLDSKDTKEVVAEDHLGGKVTLQDYGDKMASWLQKATGLPGIRLTGIGRNYVRHVGVNPYQNDAVPQSPAHVNLGDEAPYLLVSQSSLDDLNRRIKLRGKIEVDMRRFRPNIIISGLRPWEEDSLRKIRIGNVDFWVWQRCGRCRMTTIDRDTLAYSGEPLATLNQFRERQNGQRNFGMHLVPVVPDGKVHASLALGELHVGETVEILEYDDERRAEWKRLFGDL